METLNRLAGVSDATTKPLPPPPPIPQDEPADTTLSRRASRASLPRDLHRTPSRRSLRSGKQTPARKSLEDIPPVPPTPGQYTTKESPRGVDGRASDATAETDDDFEWGPSHPCFPHLNPHCLPTSEEFRETRVIRVKRDWLVSGDLYPQYQNLYPDILDPLVSDSDFRFLLTNINTRLERIFTPWSFWAVFDAVMGVLTGFFWDDLGLTHAKRGIRELESFVDRWNADKERNHVDIRLVQLRRTGFINMDFIVPDPGLDAADGDTQAKE